MMLSGKICTRWIVREKNYDCFLLVTGVYIYIYKHTFVLLHYIIVLYGSFFPFLNFESFYIHP